MEPLTQSDNDRIFLDKLQEIEPTLYKIYKFMCETSRLFEFGEMEMKVTIHCANYRDKRLTVEGTQNGKTVRESFLLNKSVDR